MFLIPISHEETTLRKVPFVAFTLIGICVAVFLRQLLLTSEEQSLRRLTEAFFYYSERSDYLDMPPELEDFFGNLDVPEELLTQLRLERGFDARSLSREQIENEQAHLESLVGKALDQTRLGFFREWGLTPAKMKAASMITALFIHAGFWHLFGNMLFLYLSGTVMEDRWGPAFFAVFYILGGVFSGLVFAHTYPNLNLPLVGASGAISAIMGAFLIKYWRTKIKFFYLIFFFIHGTFEAPAWIILPFWFIAQVLMAGLTHNINPEGGGGVAYLAHIGGFVFGVAVALGYAWSGLERKWSPTGIDLDAPEHNPLRAAELELNRGKKDKALEILAKGATEEPNHIELLLAYRDLAKSQARMKDQVRALQKLIKATLKEGWFGEAYEHWLDLREAAPRLHIHTGLSLELAQALTDNQLQSEAGAVLENAFASSRDPNPKVLIKMAGIAARAAAPIGKDILQSARSLPALSPSETQRLQELETALQRSLSEAQNRGLMGRGSPFQEPDGEGIALSAPIHSDDSGSPFAPALNEEPTVEEAPSYTPMVQKLQIFDAIPRAIDQRGWLLYIQGKHQRHMRFDQIKAMALAAIRQKEGRPYLILDLIHDDLEQPLPKHRAFRIRSDSFDPRSLVKNEPQPARAFLKLIGFSLKKSRAKPLPELQALLGKPFCAFSQIEEFEKAIYYKI